MKVRIIITALFFTILSAMIVDKAGASPWRNRRYYRYDRYGWRRDYRHEPVAIERPDKDGYYEHDFYYPRRFYRRYYDDRYYRDRYYSRRYYRDRYYDDRYWENSYRYNRYRDDRYDDRYYYRGGGY